MKVIVPFSVASFLFACSVLAKDLEAPLNVGEVGRLSWRADSNT